MFASTIRKLAALAVLAATFSAVVASPIPAPQPEAAEVAAREANPDPQSCIILRTCI